MAMEKFHHKLTFTTEEDGAEVEQTHKLVLPKFDQIPFGLIRRFRKLPDADQFFSLLEALVSEKDLEALDQCTQKEVNKLMTAWQKDAGVGLGES